MKNEQSGKVGDNSYGNVALETNIALGGAKSKKKNDFGIFLWVMIVFMVLAFAQTDVDKVQFNGAEQTNLSISLSSTSSTAQAPKTAFEAMLATSSAYTASTTPASVPTVELETDVSSSPSTATSPSASPASPASTENPVNATNGLALSIDPTSLFFYDFMKQYDISQVGWNQIGNAEDLCWFSHKKGITVRNTTDPNAKCVLFHSNPNQLNYSEIRMTLTLEELTSGGIVIIKDEGNPTEDDRNYYRFLIDVGIGGSYRSVIQEVYIENGATQVREIASKEYDYKPNTPYTIILVRNEKQVQMYVAEQKKTPIAINEMPFEIPYANLSKIGFKITDSDVSNTKRVYVQEFGLYK